MASVKRLVNRRREKMRPKCPSTLDEELMSEHIPKDFLIGDVRSPDNKARHIILSSKKQLSILANKLVLYIDGTFEVSIMYFYPPTHCWTIINWHHIISNHSNVFFLLQVVKEPYKQLVSIHAYVKQDGVKKQIPLVFAIMSRRQKEDYNVLFKTIIEAVKKETGHGKTIF